MPYDVRNDIFPRSLVLQDSGDGLADRLKHLAPIVAHRRLELPPLPLMTPPAPPRSTGGNFGATG